MLLIELQVTIIFNDKNKNSIDKNYRSFILFQIIKIPQIQEKEKLIFLRNPALIEWKKVFLRSTRIGKNFYSSHFHVRLSSHFFLKGAKISTYSSF